MARHMTARRRKGWLDIPSIQLDGITAAGTQLGGSLPFTGPGHTIERMIIPSIGLFNRVAASAATESLKVVMALGIVSTDAFDAGAGSVPEPGDEPEFPWLFWTVLNLVAVDASAGLEQPSMQYRTPDYDVRTKRKIGARQSLCWIVQHTEPVATTMNASLVIPNVRVLLSLP